MSAAAPLQTAQAKAQKADNSALFLQRKCACGSGASPLTGECAECSTKKRSGLQTKLKVNEPGDIYEQEADRIADQVMAPSAHSAVSGAPPHIQRHAGQATEGTDTAPASVDRTLASPGRPLESTLRRDMEQRFGHDFSQVRVHSGAAAEQSAQDVNANAYTVGHNVVFGAGQFAPGTHEGRRLLAHELTHVVQQSGSEGIRSGQGNTKSSLPPISDNVNIADHASVDPSNPPLTVQPVPYLQRKMTVLYPEQGTDTEGQLTNAETILSYLKTLCPGGALDVDLKKGWVKILNTGFCTRPWGFSWSSTPWLDKSPAETSATPTGCDCICDLVSSGNEWEILVSDSASGPETIPDNTKAAVGAAGGFGFLNGTGGTIITPSERNPKRIGVATEPGQVEVTPAWLIFGHELCGHAWNMNKGGEKRQDAERRGRGGHQESVRIENILRAEFNLTHPLEPLEMRAKFCGPYCGESFWRDKANPSIPQSFENKASGEDQGRTFIELCQEERDKYNKDHDTTFKIEDQLPDDCLPIFPPR